MTKHIGKSSQDERDLEAIALQQAEEATFAARSQTVNRVRGRGVRCEATVTRLWKETLKSLGDKHCVTLEMEKAVISEQYHSGRVSAADAAVRMARLADRCTTSLGDAHRVTRQVQALAAKYSRYSGNPRWRDEYEELIRSAEDRYGKDSRLASIKRSNYSVALNEWGRSFEDRDRAYRVAKLEWDWRLDAFGPDDPFVYVAAANALSAALRAMQYGKPVLDERKMRESAAHVYQRRLELLGTDHESTQGSFVTLHSIRAECAESDALWQLLTVVGREQENKVVPALAERLPIALSRAFALAGDMRSARLYLDKARQVLESNYGPATDRTNGAVAFLERSIRESQL